MPNPVLPPAGGAETFTIYHLTRESGVDCDQAQEFVVIAHNTEHARRIAGDCDLGNCRSWGAGAFRLLLVSTTNGDVMKIFVAGASRAIGSQLVAQLVARGHEVVVRPARLPRPARCARSVPNR